MLISNLPWVIESTLIGTELRDAQNNHIASFSNEHDAEFILELIRLHCRNEQKYNETTEFGKFLMEECHYMDFPENLFNFQRIHDNMTVWVSSVGKIKVGKKE